MRSLGRLAPAARGAARALSTAAPRTLGIIGAPMSLGQPLAGTEKAPAALRAAGLAASAAELGWAVRDYGDAAIPTAQPTDPRAPVPARNAFAVGRGCAAVADMVTTSATAGEFVLTLGGDHSVAVGTLGGILRAHPNARVLWVDAHADINTPSVSPSGNLHGMPIAFLMRLVDPASVPGYEWLTTIPRLEPSRLVYVGLRDIDAGERRLIKELGIRAYTMTDVDRHGIGKVMEMSLDHLLRAGTGAGGTPPLHLSFDIDGVDPSVAPSTGTAVPGGLSYREAHYVAEACAASGALWSMDMVEVNPDLLPAPAAHGSAPVAGNPAWKGIAHAPGAAVGGGAQTVSASLAFISSALGRTILDS